MASSAQIPCTRRKKIIIIIIIKKRVSIRASFFVSKVESTWPENNATKDFFLYALYYYYVVRGSNHYRLWFLTLSRKPGKRLDITKRVAYFYYLRFICFWKIQKLKFVWILLCQKSKRIVLFFQSELITSNYYRLLRNVPRNVLQDIF